LEDNELAQAAARGEQTAFAALFERYREYVYRLAYKVALDPEEALDATQATFLKVAEKIGQYDGRGNFRGWLATVAVRTAIDLARKNRETATDPVDLAEVVENGQQRWASRWTENPFSVQNPRMATEHRERLEQVEEAMKSLSVQQRAILTLQISEDLGPKEIADRLEIPAGQVRSQLDRAIKKLREQLV
jgi:RNA polymerase sigma-70 factor (ECF subfamily)